MARAEKPRRKTQSQTYLEQALVQLLEIKPYEAITVKELVERAGVSRTGFYNQFGSMYGFVEHMVIDYNDGAYEAASSGMTSEAYTAADISVYYQRFFGYVADNANVYRVMLSDNGIPEFRLHMRQSARNMWKRHILFPRLPDPPPAEAALKAELISRYVASAHIGLCLFYLDGNLHLGPAFMAEQVLAITWPAVMSYMGFNE